MTLQLIFTIVVSQNKQLLKIIAEEEGLDYDDLLTLIPTHQEVVQYVLPRRRCNPISTGSSESFESFEPSSLDE